MRTMKPNDPFAVIFYFFFYFLVFTTVTSQNITEKVDPNTESGPTLNEDQIIRTCKPCECGNRYRDDSRIMGGTYSKEYEFPWIVSLFNSKGTFLGGGSLITDQYVLTAAHCADKISSDNPKVFVLFGQIKRPLDLNTNDSNVVEVVKIIRHENYKRDPFGSDIALLKLAKPVKFNGSVQSICLPVTRTDYGGLKGTVAGWGSTGTVSLSQDLKRDTLELWNMEECKKDINRPRLTPNVICAGHKEIGRGVCYGDSGGPLMVVEDNDKFSVAGIISWGVGKCADGIPSLFTRVDKYLAWIMQNTKDACYCTK